MSQNPQFHSSDRSGSDVGFERHRLESIFRETPAAMALWCGWDMVFEMVNPSYQRLFPDRQLLGMPFNEAIPEFKDQPFLDIFRKVLETGESFVGHEVLARHRTTVDGPIEDHYYDFTYARITDENGKPYGVYDHAIEVTDRVLARRAMEKSQEQLKKAIAELENERAIRDRFVATLTHDLRTPLTAAKMSAQLVGKRAADQPEIQKMAARISNHMDRADEMIRNLLDVVSIKAGKSLTLDFAECRLNRLVSEVLEDLSSVHGDRFSFQVTEQIKGYSSCTGIRRILENLCTNAIKYGSPLTTVTVSVAREGERVRISVHNEGVPIPAEEMSRLFEPFTRASTALTGGQKGWGLGLTLVKGIAETLGGTVEAKSEARLGTTFTVTIPLSDR